jgi:hypothetical protein
MPPRRRGSRLHQHKPAAGRKQVRQPPLRQLKMTELHWLDDMVPDFLWAAGVIAGDPDKGLRRLARIVDVAEDARAAVAPDRPEPIDGSLTAFESLNDSERRVVADAIRTAGLASMAVPVGFVHAIGMYPDAPGSWLADLAAERPDHVDPEIAEEWLNTAIATIAGGRDEGGTTIKATVVRQMLRAGRIHLAGDSGPPIDELTRYPDNVTADERGMVESSLRALFNSMQGMNEERVAPRRAWAERFWNTNWQLFVCKVRADEAPVDTETAVPGGLGTEAEAASDETMTTNEAELAERADTFGTEIAEIWQNFLSTVATSDPRLYDPARSEVLTGLTAHALRLTIAVAAHPGLWIGEFSAGLLRSVSEVIVDLAWFDTAEGREPEAPRRFKEFGRGRLKLAKLHAEELADRHERSPMFEEVIESLDKEVNQEVGEEFQDISLEATFTGRDLRKMAIASGTDSLYKLQLAPMSSVVHSEWPTLTRYAMELCVNPVHRLHWLPRTSLTPALRPTAGQTAVVLAQMVFEAYVRAIGPIKSVEVAESNNDVEAHPI